jgi:uncharacterized protein with von Willebrand factor type A (vWA) domain
MIIKTKKRAFFAYLLPLVRQSNRDVSQERVVLLQVSQRLKHHWPLALHPYWAFYQIHSLQPAFPHSLNIDGALQNTDTSRTCL